MDRADLNFARLHVLHLNGAHCVRRAKTNTKLTRRYSRVVDNTTGGLCDQIVVTDGGKTAKHDPDMLRRIKDYDTATNKILVFLTTDCVLPPQTLADLYRSRWQVALFFKWIQQNLRITSVFGPSETAVKSQIGIAVSVLVAMIRHRLKIDLSLHTILQILSVNPFEKTSLNQLLSNQQIQKAESGLDKQLK